MRTIVIALPPAFVGGHNKFGGLVRHLDEGFLQVVPISKFESVYLIEPQVFLIVYSRVILPMLSLTDIKKVMMTIKDTHDRVDFGPMQVPQHQLSARLLVVGLLKVHVGCKFFDNFNGHVMLAKPNFHNKKVGCTEFTLGAPTHTFCYQ
jgi:hypothetical protein